VSILAGDIGGTKTVLGVFELTPAARGGLTLRRREVFPSASHPSLEAIVTEFLARVRADGIDGAASGDIRAAAFGVAGPVLNGEAQVTNLHWVIREPALREATGAPVVRLLNDLESTAFGMLRLADNEMAVLNAGRGRRFEGGVAVIAAGTGLGEAFLWWDGERHHAIASEGGHADFAPRNDMEDSILAFLRREHPGHVSVERVLSGPGIHNIYRALLDRGAAPESPETATRMRTMDPNAVIAEAAIRGDDPLAIATMDIFVSIYGAEAGNLALRTLPAGGVMLGGGIAPHILPLLTRGGFMQAFTAKGRFQAFLESLPVAISLEPDASLRGAAYVAARAAGAA